MGLPNQTLFEKSVLGVETHWLSIKENIPGVVISKDQADSLQGSERTHHYEQLPIAYSFMQIHFIYLPAHV